MKLATLRNGDRDGALALVDRAGTRALPVTEIAATLQQALDKWDQLEPLLRKADALFRSGRGDPGRAVSEADFMAPLPRAFQLLDGGGYMPHLDLGMKLRQGVEGPDFLATPIFYQSVSDTILAGSDPITLAPGAHGTDFEAEIAIITGDVAQGDASDPARHIRLVMLMNDVSLRAYQPAEMSAGFGFYACKPAKSFAPFAITPDEYPDAWQDNCLNLPVTVTRNGQLFGAPHAGVDLNFDFATLIAAAAKTRPLGAGTIIAGGTVSNWDLSAGKACLLEQRLLERFEHGEERTPWLDFGERIRIEVLHPDGHSLFGAIDQEILSAAM